MNLNQLLLPIKIAGNATLHVYYRIREWHTKDEEKSKYFNYLSNYYWSCVSEQQC